MLVVSFTCSDAGSGVATCPASIPVSTEGANQVFSGTVAMPPATPPARRSRSILIRRHPQFRPTVIRRECAGRGPATSATVTFTCSDALSGVLSCPSPVTVTASGPQNISGAATDIAEHSQHERSIHTSGLTPLAICGVCIAAPNAANWNNTPSQSLFNVSAVRLRSHALVQQVVRTDGANQVVSGTATDALGNRASASVTINLDQTPPLISISSPLTARLVLLPAWQSMAGK